MSLTVSEKPKPKPTPAPWPPPLPYEVAQELDRAQGAIDALRAAFTAPRVMASSEALAQVALSLREELGRMMARGE